MVSTFHLGEQDKFIHRINKIRDTENLTDLICKAPTILATRGSRARNVLIKKLTHNSLSWKKKPERLYFQNILNNSHVFGVVFLWIFKTLPTPH